MYIKIYIKKDVEYSTSINPLINYALLLQGLPQGPLPQTAPLTLSLTPLGFITAGLVYLIPSPSFFCYFLHIQLYYTKNKQCCQE